MAKIAEQAERYDGKLQHSFLKQFVHIIKKKWYPL